jgi:hypothetical protein
MDRGIPPAPNEGTPRDATNRGDVRDESVSDDIDRDELDLERSKKASHKRVEPNPPRTTTGKMTAPKFGSAGSGGLELEPGPPKP